MNIKCQCKESDKHGETSVMCCNHCGLPTEDFWTNGESPSHNDIVQEMEEDLYGRRLGDTDYEDGILKTLQKYLPKLKQIGEGSETEDSEYTNGFRDGLGFTQKTCIYFAEWKDRVFKISYPSNGKVYILKEYESVNEFPGLKFGEHYSIPELYVFFAENVRPSKLNAII